MNRCPWAGSDPDYIAYHDNEWGIPVHDDKKLFEFLVLESAQAGLSWITILRRREAYRNAYDCFDPAKVAQYSEEHINWMIENTGIIRNRKKIESSINNAKLFLGLQKEYGSFDNYIWGFVNHKPIINHFESMDEIPTSTELSDQITKDMKKSGFKFIGTTIMYAYMQAIGMVNDHLVSCHKYYQNNNSQPKKGL